MSQKNSLKNIGTISLISSTRIESFLTDMGLTDVYMREGDHSYNLFFEASAEKQKQVRDILEREFSLFFHPQSLSPQDRIVHLLMRLGKKAAVAESCTGGMVGSLITSVPGSSKVFWGGLITYDNDAKVKLIGVDPDIIESYGAVSPETVSAMVLGLLTVCKVQMGIAVSGIAGPGGGSPEKPVGTVWIGVGGSDKGVITRKLLFSGTRSEIRKKAAAAALLLGESYLLEGNLDTNMNWQYT